MMGKRTASEDLKSVLCDADDNVRIAGSDADRAILANAIGLVAGLEAGSIPALIEQAHATAVSKGWWDEERSLPEIIALIHSELSEALELYRDGMNVSHVYIDKETGKPVGVAVEFADVLIRIFDVCNKMQIDLVGALEKKMKYNTTRPYKHGGKKI